MIGVDPHVATAAVQIGELRLGLVDDDGRYVLRDSHRDGIRVHIPTSAPAQEVTDTVRAAIIRNADWIADVLTTNLAADEPALSTHSRRTT
jgi:hypothetical protein